DAAEQASARHRGRLRVCHGAERLRSGAVAVGRHHGGPQLKIRNSEGVRSPSDLQPSTFNRYTEGRTAISLPTPRIPGTWAAVSMAALRAPTLSWRPPR